METNIPFEEAVLRAKVAQICDSVGYNAITHDSSNILVDIYRRTFHHLARHCKDAANNNGRTVPTFIDLIQAYNFVGISIPELKEYVEAIKLPLVFDLTRDEDEKPANRIQRNLHVDDLLEAEKNSHLGNHEDGENQPSSDIEGEDKPNAPLLKDTYEEIVSRFSSCNPVAADKKIGMGGRLILVPPILKISPPIPPEAKPSTSVKKRGKKELGKKRKLTNEIIAESIAPPDAIKVKKKKKLPKVSVSPKVKEEKPVEEVKLVEEVKPPEEEKPVEVEKPVVVEESKIKIADVPVPTPPSKKRKLADEIIAQPTVSSEAIKVKKKKKMSKESVSPKPKKKKQAKKKEFTIEVASKKPKTVVTPLDPAIAEPPSFFPIPVVPSSSMSQEDLCPECNLPDDGSMMIQCDDPDCAKWFHGKCVNLLEEPEEDESWFCRVCVDKQQSAFDRRRRPK